MKRSLVITRIREHLEIMKINGFIVKKIMADLNTKSDNVIKAFYLALKGYKRKEIAIELFLNPARVSQFFKQNLQSIYKIIKNENTFAYISEHQIISKIDDVPDDQFLANREYQNPTSFQLTNLMLAMDAFGDEDEDGAFHMIKGRFVNLKSYEKHAKEEL